MRQLMVKNEQEGIGKITEYSICTASIIDNNTTLRAPCKISVEVFRIGDKIYRYAPFNLLMQSRTYLFGITISVFRQQRGGRRG